MVAQGDGKPTVKSFTLTKIGIDLRRIVADKIKELLPNAGEFVIVTRKGRPEVRVEVEPSKENNDVPLR